MAKTYSRETSAALGSGNYAKADGRHYQAKLKCIRATIDFDGQADTDTIVLGKLPPGARFSHGIITAKATLGASATLAIGVEGDAAAFRSAATLTVTTPTLFGKADAVAADPYLTEKTLIATVGTASLPNSTDFAVIELFYSDAA